MSENVYLISIPRNELKSLIKDSIRSVLSETEGAQQSKTKARKYINVSQLALLLGLKKSSIYGLTHRNSIPYYRKNKILYFDETEIEAWLKSGRRKTTDEMLAEAGNGVIFRNDDHENR